MKSSLAVSSPVRPNRVALQDARAGLALIWLVGGGIVFAMLIVQSFTNVYLGYTKEVWNWALPNLLPVLTLVLSVWGHEALREQPIRYTVDRRFLRVVKTLSYVYLFLVLAIVLSHSFTSAWLDDPVDLRGIMEPFVVSSLFLGPLQAIVVLVLSTLFFKSHSATENATGGA